MRYPTEETNFRYVEIKNGIMSIFEGDGFYDLHTRFDIKNLRKLVEEIGVKGGHVGFKILYFNPLGEYCNTEEELSSYDFGRKQRWAMDLLKDLMDRKVIKMELIQEFDKPTKCY